MLLAGGLGTRMREETEFRPKPMVEIGGRPVLTHIMSTYASHGFTDFIICGGYKHEMIENYFVAANNPTLPPQWSVSVVDTGLESSTGERLGEVRNLIGEETFLCAYGDGIAPVNITNLVQFHLAQDAGATVTLAHPTSRFGIVELEDSGFISQFREKPIMDELVSIGFFVFGPALWTELTDNAPLEAGLLHRLAAKHQLAGYVHDGFWQPMDTYRELLELQALWDSGNAPWQVDA